MASEFVQSLIVIRAQHEQEMSAFQSAWKEARQRVTRAFIEAKEALNDAEVKHENGDTSTLSWRGQQLSFKADANCRKIIRSATSGRQEDAYAPASLTKQKIEDEVRDFTREALGLKT